MIISRENKNLINLIFYVVLFSFVMDFVAIVSTLYVAPELDGFAIAEVLVYFKALIGLAIIVLLMVWNRNRHFRLSIQIIRMLLVTLFVIMIAYFVYLYIYKFYLVDQVVFLIQERIIGGNPSLIPEFSALSLKSLTYVLTVYMSTNSELILFIQALLLTVVLTKTKLLKTEPESEHHYDEFLFSKADLPLGLTILVLTFISIKLFSMQYYLSDLAEIIISITGFIAAIPLFIATLRVLSVSDNQTCSHTYFKTQFITIISMTSLIFATSLSLFIYHLAMIYINGFDYRMISALLAAIVAIPLFLRARYVLSLENK